MSINSRQLTHFIRTSPLLSIIDSVAEVALPPPLVQEGHKGVDVGPAGATPDNGAGGHHRKLLQSQKQVEITSHHITSHNMNAYKYWRQKTSGEDTFKS